LHYFQAQPSTHLADVMSKTIYTAFPEQSLQEVDHYFANISGLPVVDKEYKCIGVLSKKDRAKVRDVSVVCMAYPTQYLHCLLFMHLVMLIEI
jgi:predicted transcriptional regulator